MTDQEIVQTVRLHFDTEVAKELRPSTARDVEGMIEILEAIEGERETIKTRLQVRGNVNVRENRYQNTANEIIRRKGASTREGEVRKILSTRESAKPSQVKNSIGWRKTNSPGEGSRVGDVDIVELPNSDDDNAVPKICHVL